MNKALREELERYFYNDDYGLQPELEEVRKVHKA